MNLKVATEKIRIDKYLTKELNITRSKAQKLIDCGGVLVNGKTIGCSYSVHLNDNIEITEEKLSNDIKTPEKENIYVNIVYEDDSLLVVNKPSGMVVHPAPGNLHGTLVNALLYHFELSNGSSILRPGIVHRIDKDTSGLLLVAKNDKVHDLLATMIKNREVHRYYIALVWGVIPHEEGTIDAPIGRDPKNREKMMVTDINAKEAITHFKVLRRYKDKTLIECKLDTGRTHQIRVHFSYIGYPIYNDPVYGKNRNTTSFGQFLHAKKLEFYHPLTKKFLSFEAPIEEEFQTILDKLD